MIYDLHTHSDNSFDSKAPIMDLCKSAINSGITDIAFTEHFSIDNHKKTYGYMNFEKYFKDIKKAKDIYSNDLNIYTGLELCEPHENPDKFRCELKDLDIDIILGSVHNINNIGHRALCEQLIKRETYDLYFNEVFKLVSLGDFDIAAHLDLMNRYAYNSLGNYDFNDFKDILQVILTKLISRGIGIEINTSGLRNSLKNIHPKIEILKLYKSLGGEIITIGSDAHKACDVGYNCKSSLALLKTLNYKYIFTFENRKPIAHNID
ncbi:histidinol-phosphatase HisJ family protein [Clostridium botulinum]|uniref:Histidinol-phosphatase n=1 Tax=Clostridium botulinum C/D str. DC5 TaxID=1443128 RepID=A0A0A0IF24_CLOBO|nr:histidinol-phosphatase HisJ family protein [Clostridium botulinum]KGN00060.1 histidinol phosphatase [Clostridium botulinum C/D str. DC5]KOC55726.1 histidinol phosphatase [Clostridium botulinum]KOC57211.1 histidinol phosphatase [Clostridium botulinum]MCD3234466.1 histidinol-phosphatase HisJ family protein [Clostridium botulinum D/C]MCD3240362.1 histidinol-phosphatase HisJ family protein [Clostridium botulinum D/C]